jgi:4a-hydroxytetrahydrobiopterin dehydratase
MSKNTKPRPMSDPEVDSALAGLEGWNREHDALTRTFTFPTFSDAMRFVNQVAGEAERADHHPDMIISYRRVTFRLSSHDAGGITQRDVRLASRITEMGEGVSS